MLKILAAAVQNLVAPERQGTWDLCLPGIPFELRANILWLHNSRCVFKQLSRVSNTMGLG